MAVLHLYALFVTLVAGFDHARYTSSPAIYPSRKSPFLSLFGLWLIYQLYDWLGLVRFIYGCNYLVRCSLWELVANLSNRSEYHRCW